MSSTNFISWFLNSDSTHWPTQEVSDWTDWIDWLNDQLIDYVNWLFATPTTPDLNVRLFPSLESTKFDLLCRAVALAESAFGHEQHWDLGCTEFILLWEPFLTSTVLSGVASLQRTYHLVPHRNLGLDLGFGVRGFDPPHGNLFLRLNLRVIVANTQLLIIY